ncbi:hypothetical protein [Telluribacter sp.]|jgi:hypothetical protein|nr:hypothetical protein [Telluribacter sp.]
MNPGEDLAYGEVLVQGKGSKELRNVRTAGLNCTEERKFRLVAVVVPEAG